MIIGATSEDITSNLLETFRRKIPVQIGLPSIEERPLQERLNITLHFLWQEAKRLGIPIRVSGDVLKAFTLYPCVANIGGLKNDLLLCLAKSYLSYMATGGSGTLELKMEHIPDRITAFISRRIVLDENILKLFEKGIVIESSESPFRESGGILISPLRGQ